MCYKELKEIDKMELLCASFVPEIELETPKVNEWYIHNFNQRSLAA